MAADHDRGLSSGEINQGTMQDLIDACCRMRPGDIIRFRLIKRVKISELPMISMALFYKTGSQYVTTSINAFDVEVRMPRSVNNPGSRI